MSDPNDPPRIADADIPEAIRSSRPWSLEGLGAGPVENFLRSYRQDDWLVRGAVVAIEEFGQPRDPEYSAFRDEGLRPFLLQNSTSLDLFRSSGSPEESRRIRQRIEDDMNRERALEMGGATWSRMAASMLGATNLATLPITPGLGFGATVGARIATGALGGAAVNAGVAALDAGLANATLPGPLQRDVGLEISMASLLGGALGGLGGAMPRRIGGGVASPMTEPELQRLVGGHAAYHDAADGMRTPGVLPEWKPWWAREDADLERMALRQAALDQMHDAVQRGDTAAYVAQREAARTAGLVDDGDAGLRPVWQQTPTEAIEGAIARNTDGGAAERVLDDLNGTPPTGRADGAPGTGDLSAAGGPGVEARASRPELPSLIERILRHRQMPFWRLVTNAIPGRIGEEVASDAGRLAQLPVGMMGGNRRGLASNATSVEAKARGWQWNYAKADAEMRQLFAAFHGWNPMQTGPLMSRVKDAGLVVGNLKADTQMTMQEFRQLVGRALHTGEVPTNRFGAEVPQALEAARAWSRHVFEPMEEAGADAGLLLTAKHADLARAHLEGELARLKIIRDELDRRANSASAGRGVTTTDPAGLAAIGPPSTMSDAQHLLAMAENALEQTAARLEQLATREGTGSRGVYAPQRWIREVVAQRRDELEAIFRRHFTLDGRGAAWASNRVRASIAVSHILRESMADTLERAVLAHLRGPSPGAKAVAMPGGLNFEVRAAALAEPLRALERETATLLDSEIASALGKTLSGNQPVRKAAELAKKALEDAGISDADMGRLVREVLSVRASDTPGMQSGHWTDSWRPAAVKERQIDVPPSAIIDFLDTDVAGVTQSYLRFMAPAVETSREFGDAGMLSHILSRGVDMLDDVKAGNLSRDGMLEAMEALANLRNVVQRIHAVPDNPDAYTVRGLRLLANMAIVTKMGSALIPNLLDATRATMSVGFRETLEGMRDALENRAAWQLGGDEAAKAGAALDLVSLEVTAARNDLGVLSGGAGKFERWWDGAANNMQFINGVAPWTELIQRFFGAKLQSDMIEYSLREAAGTISPEDLVRLRALGVSAEDAAAYASEWTRAGANKGGKLHLAATDDWLDETARTNFRAQLTTAVDLAVTKPGAADRPMFMSAPLWQVVFLFKGFAVASTQRMVLTGIMQRDARAYQAMMAGVGLAWLLNGPSEGPYDKHPIASTERIYDAISRSGWLGILSDISNTAEVATNNGIGLRPLLGLDPPTFAKDPSWGQRVESVLGAASSPYFSAIDAFTGEMGTAGQQAGAIRRMTPFNNWLPIAGSVRALGREAETFMPGAEN